MSQMVPTDLNNNKTRHELMLYNLIMPYCNTKFAKLKKEPSLNLINLYVASFKTYNDPYMCKNISKLKSTLTNSVPSTFFQSRKNIDQHYHSKDDR